jgi:hypothetical protein
MIVSGRLYNQCMSLEGESIPPDAPRYRCEYCGLNTAVIIPRRFHRARIVSLIIEATILFPIALIGVPLLLMLCCPGGWRILGLTPVGFAEIGRWDEALSSDPNAWLLFFIVFTLVYIFAVISVSYFPPYSTSRRIYCLQCGWEKVL